MKKLNETYESYYHISFKNNLHNNLIVPQIPQCITESELVDKEKVETLENTSIARFCMSKSIEGCLNSVSHLLKLLDTYPHLTFYVYTNKNKINKFYDSEYLNDNRLVFDAHETEEIWVLDPLELVLLGYFNIDKSYLKEKLEVKNFNEDNNYHQYFFHYKFNELPPILQE